MSLALLFLVQGANKLCGNANVSSNAIIAKLDTDVSL